MATENEQLSTWLRPEEAQALRELATHEQRSVSLMIRLIVLEYLKVNGSGAQASAGQRTRAATKKESTL